MQHADDFYALSNPVVNHMKPLLKFSVALQHVLTFRTNSRILSQQHEGFI